ncbi:MAG: hypothetical protein AAFR04_07885, partial [Pseudomonadota bacterium]
RLYAYGVGIEPNIVQAAKWHLLARGAGVDDGALDQYISRLTPDDRKRATAAAARWRQVNGPK